MSEPLYHDEDTLHKVYKALRKNWPYASDQKLTDVVSDLQNEGILFRERANGRVDWEMMDWEWG